LLGSGFGLIIGPAVGWAIVAWAVRPWLGAAVFVASLPIYLAVIALSRLSFDDPLPRWTPTRWALAIGFGSCVLVVPGLIVAIQFLRETGQIRRPRLLRRSHVSGSGEYAEGPPDD
jgi:hypothetical protein